MAQGRNTLMDPPIEDLLDKVDSKFTLVALGSARARQVNSYYNSLGEGLGKVVPPQVASVSGKPVSIAFEEIAAGKATYTRIDPEEEAAWPRRADGARRGGRQILTEVKTTTRDRRGGRGARRRADAVAEAELIEFSTSGTRTRPRASRRARRDPAHGRTSRPTRGPPAPDRPGRLRGHRRLQGRRGVPAAGRRRVHVIPVLTARPPASSVR
jgi:DNA-directed RNA polymerase subunit omega